MNRLSHDRIFKEFLTRFLPDFLRLFVPEQAERLNFDTLTFLDKELIFNMPDQTLRITDVVAEVETHEGKPEIIVVHVEVEARDKQSLPWRMFEYYALLRILRQKPVLPMALVLLPNAGGLSRQTYQESLFGQEHLQFTYVQVGVRDLDGVMYLQTGNPVGAALTALMQSGQKSPAEIKLAAWQSVINAEQLTRGDKLFLIQLMEQYLPTELLVNAGDALMEELTAVRITWVDEALDKGREEGLQEGLLTGRKEMLLHLLTMRFGQLSPEFTAVFQAIQDTAVLDHLAEQLLTIETLSDLDLPSATS